MRTFYGSNIEPKTQEYLSLVTLEKKKSLRMMDSRCWSFVQTPKVIKSQDSDPLEEVNIGSEDELHMTWINSLAKIPYKRKLIELISKYKD